MDSANAIAADIGNSWVKLAGFELGKSEWQFRRRDRWRDPIQLEFLNDSPRDWFVSSVSKPGFENLRAAIRKERKQDRIFEVRYSDVPIDSNLDYPEKTGIDRFCAAAGAWDYAKSKARNGPLTVVDIGTAVTVDLVDAHGCFQGGAIFIGPVKALQELSEQTDALPDITQLELGDDLNAIGKNTVEALKGGAIFSLVGGVKELIARQQTSIEIETEVWLTGGGAPFIESFSPSEWIFRDDLVLHGIRLAAKSMNSD